MHCAVQKRSCCLELSDDWGCGHRQVIVRMAYTAPSFPIRCVWTWAALVTPILTLKLPVPDLRHSCQTHVVLKPGFTLHVYMTEQPRMAKTLVECQSTLLWRKLPLVYLVQSDIECSAAQHHKVAWGLGRRFLILHEIAKRWCCTILLQSPNCCLSRSTASVLQALEVGNSEIAAAASPAR